MGRKAMCQVRAGNYREWGLDFHQSAPANETHALTAAASDVFVVLLTTTPHDSTGSKLLPRTLYRVARLDASSHAQTNNERIPTEDI